MKHFSKYSRCLIGCLQTAYGVPSAKRRTKFVLWNIPALLIIFSLLLAGLLYPQLEPLYKSGAIELEADKTFGSQTGWESLFYDMYKSIAIGPDGSIFVSNSRQHTIFKFSTTGKLAVRFGRKGQGPGDLNSPQRLSVLDNKYLVIGEYPTTRRINLFNLEGKFEKVLRTQHSCFSPLALKNNRIAYLSFLHKNEPIRVVKVWIKNVETGHEILVTSSEIPFLNRIKARNNYMLSFDNHLGQLLTARTGEGNLLVGISNTPGINIYSPQGKLLHSFRLNIKPLPVTSRYIREFKQVYASWASEKKAVRPYLNSIKKASFEKAFGDYLPYYRRIVVDSGGNILVFKWLDCVNKCQKIFQVYSPDGNFKSEVSLDEGEFEVEIDYRWDRLVFSNRGIFAFVQPKNSDDISPRLIKVNVPGGR